MTIMTLQYDNNKIAVCTGEDNIQKYFSTTNSYNWSANIDDITPTWRNPMYGEWDLVKEDLESQGFEVVNISYRERLSDTINKLEDCSSIIGYYGVTQFLALLMNLPLISVYDNSKNDRNNNTKILPIHSCFQRHKS